MKRLLALLLVLVLCLALAACGDSKKKSDDDDDDDDDGEVVTTTTVGADDPLNPVDPVTRPLPTANATVVGTMPTLPVPTTTAPTAAPTVPTAPAVDSSVAAYVAQNKSQVEAMSNDAMTMALEARGTAVVYVAAYTTIYDATQEMVDAMQQNMATQSSTLATALAGMKSECPAVTAIIYEFYTADGDLIYSYEYK